jgi:V8-like Glu-specific endopeptidase
MVMTNGHCVSSGMGGMMPANRFLSHVASKRTFQFLAADGSIKPGQVAATELVYATITWNDVALYSLEKSYAQIKRDFGIDALLIDPNHPQVGDSIEVLSGYWQRGYSCSIDRFVYELHEAEYVSKDSMRYSKGGCETIHGTSGSPILNARTHAIVGINSTGNDNGERCTMDNPCEVSESGAVYVERGRSYGDQIHVFYSCLNSAGKIDVSVPGCLLYHSSAFSSDLR